MTKRLPDVAILECVAELRAACRLPIEEPALATLVGWLRPNFERILNHTDGPKRWADHGQRLRDNARHLGAFADFFADHAGSPTIDLEAFTRAFQLARADCTVRGERTPVAFEFCNPPVGIDAHAAEGFLRQFAPVLEPV